MITMLDIGQIIAVIAYSSIGVLIVSIIVGTVVSNIRKNRQNKEQSIEEKRLEEIIKTNPDELFNFDIKFYKTNRQFISKLTYDVDWSVVKKITLLKQKGYLKYAHSDYFNMDSVCFDDQHRSDIAALICDSFTKSFRKTKNDKNRFDYTLVDITEGLYCFIFYHLLADDPFDGHSSWARIKDHKALFQLSIDLASELNALGVSKKDEMFEKQTNEIYSMFPAKWIKNCCSFLFDFLDQ